MSEEDQYQFATTIVTALTELCKMTEQMLIMCKRNEQMIQMLAMENSDDSTESN